MKRILGIAALASVLASSAFAADMPVKAPRIVEPLWTWTGFYVGVNGGYSWGRSNTSITPFAAIFPAVPFTPFKQDVDGGIGGGQIGYNWQVDPRWLVGVEADLQYSGERSSRNLNTISVRYPSNGVGIPVGLAGPDFNSIATLSSVFAVARTMPDAYRLLYRYAAHEPEFAGYVAELTDRELHRAEAMLARVPDPAIRAWMARLVSRTVDEAFLNWLDVGDPAQDAVMVERVVYLLGGMVGSLWKPSGDPPALRDG